MAHRVISDDAFLEIALDLFRTYGFEGVSLKMLSDKTGLEKASLYYRYPAGKDQIVTTVAESVAAWFESNIFDLLNGTGTPRARITLVAERLKEFYLNGVKASILDVLSIQAGPEELRVVLRKMTQRFPLALQAFSFLFRGVQRGYFSFTQTQRPASNVSSGDCEGGRCRL